MQQRGWGKFRIINGISELQKEDDIEFNIDFTYDCNLEIVKAFKSCGNDQGLSAKDSVVF